MTLSQQIRQTTLLRDAQKGRHREHENLSKELFKLTALKMGREMRKAGITFKREYEQVLRPKYQRQF